MKNITIRGARTHNLKNIDVTIPRNKLTVITGLSGSGKSSLALNTLYAEGQRRYVESLSSYARQFLSLMEKPDVDAIEGLSPAISIEQKFSTHNPRSTVGTITEIHDYLRLLFARIGEPECPKHHIRLKAQTISQMIESTLTLPVDTKIAILSPLIENRKGEYNHLFEQLIGQGFIRARIDGELYELESAPSLDAHKKHTIDIVIDRLKIKKGIETRLAESFETALRLSEGLIKLWFLDKSQPEQLLSARHACPKCDYSLTQLEPRLFSFNNPIGACDTCDGLGVQEFFDESLVITDAKLSLAHGAIRGWDQRNLYYFSLMLSLSNHYGFDVEQPFNTLPKNIQQLILYGSGEEKIRLSYINDRGTVFEKVQPFEGVIPNMERRYRQTESETIRQNLRRYINTKTCPSCEGTRLKQSARHVFIKTQTLPDLTNLPIHELQSFFNKLKLKGQNAEIAEPILKEIGGRLQFLVNVGLDYLTLSRQANTLSGGETQRIRLASQIGSGLVGVMYILDEPSIGLHQRDNQRLLNTLTHLRDIGNTVIVIEHDEEAICAADHIIDLGPAAGENGGHLVADGDLTTIKKTKASLTGQYLSHKKSIPIPKKRRTAQRDQILRLSGATCNNLKTVNVDIPLGLITCITGVSGSGKSSLINDTLYPIVANQLNKWSHLKVGPYQHVSGLEWLDKVIDINQSPIGRTPRSNPATYTGVFTFIRELFAETPEARSRGYKTGRFSFNVPGGRCQTCKGEGLIKVDMHFLADLYVNCDQCKGKRYNRETLDIRYKGKTIHDVLDMTVQTAHSFFEAIPPIKRKLETLIQVGLSYIRLGQSATTLSGGEAQRIKLSRELSKRDTGHTLYLLDEPTTGLHFHDVQQLLKVLYDLRDRGNTIVIIEHNLDVIKTADWIVDLGPEGGSQGGHIIAEGTPETVAMCRESYTGQFLARIFHK
jgi:excinuclease ABC subunit A